MCEIWYLIYKPFLLSGSLEGFSLYLQICLISHVDLIRMITVEERDVVNENFVLILTARSDISGLNFVTTFRDLSRPAVSFTCFMAWFQEFGQRDYAIKLFTS